MSVFDRLAKVQAELKAPKGQYNEYAKFHYRNVEDILQVAKPLCIEHGLVLTLSDTIEQVADRIYLKAVASVHCIGDTIPTEQNDYSVSAFAREAIAKKGMDDSQITGASSSYARKYALNGLFGIDDTKDADSMPPVEANPLKCSECAKPITGTDKASAQEIADWSFKNCGRVLCASCAKKATKGE